MHVLPFIFDAAKVTQIGRYFTHSYDAWIGEISYREEDAMRIKFKWS